MFDVEEEEYGFTLPVIQEKDLEESTVQSSNEKENHQVDNENDAGEPATETFTDSKPRRNAAIIALSQIRKQSQMKLNSKIRRPNNKDKISEMDSFLTDIKIEKSPVHAMFSKSVLADTTNIIHKTNSTNEMPPPTKKTEPVRNEPAKPKYATPITNPKIPSTIPKTTDGRLYRTTGAISKNTSAFDISKFATTAKPSRAEIQIQEKRDEQKRRLEKEEEAQFKKNAMLQAKVEKQRKKREEKQIKAKTAREEKEREKEEKLRQLLREKDEKQQEWALRMATEAEEKRKYEAMMKQNHEEKKKLYELKMKKLAAEPPLPLWAQMKESNSIDEDTDKEEDIRNEPSIPSHVTGYVLNVDTELVRLLKVGPTPLQHRHDIIYDQTHAVNTDNTDDNATTSGNGGKNGRRQQHHSGHFRHEHTEVWDPHPEYEVRAFGHTWHLVLRHDSRFVRIPGTDGRGGTGMRIEVTHVWQNYTQRVPLNVKTTGCFYTGKVRGEEDGSDVAVSLCGGMTGYIRSKEGNFYIEPAEEFKNISQASVLHRIHRISNSTDMKLQQQHQNGQKQFGTTRTLTQQEHLCDTDTDKQIKTNEDIHHHRSKRSSWTTHFADGVKPGTVVGNGVGGGFVYRNDNSKNREYFIETLVVADKKMAEYHKTDENLIHYVLTLMSHVALLYKDATIGNPISMSVVHIMILKDRQFVRPVPIKYEHFDSESVPESDKDGVNSAEMLQKFCEFQSQVNGPENTFLHHDTALLLTRENLCRNTDTGQCDTLGLAELGTMCSMHSSCAIIKDKGLPTSYTIAHELGHVLSMPHDDDHDKCSRYNAADAGVKYIMGRMIQNDSKPWLWSNCSKRYLTEFLESKRSICLLDTPTFDLITNNSRVLPGETFDGDRQCELVYGNGLKLCSYMHTYICRQLWCEIKPGENKGCQTHNHPWADGTSCGAGLWCHRGQCVAKNPELLTPVAGGWGRWHKWGTCSRTCGGGIRRAERECDNPRPANGGPYCIGPSVRYVSCNTAPCEMSAIDFREQQCAVFNGNTRGIPGLTRTVKWVPKYGGTEEMCKLYCRVQHTNQHYLLAERVIDGTKCGLNSFDVCVNGACHRGGCDNRLDSNLTLDACGICGGDNSRCVQMSGSYNAQPKYGYSKVVRIPMGSSNVDIRQHGHAGSHEDGNFLALVDSETGKYVLNGGQLVTAFHKEFMYGGVILEYTGTSSVVERINSSGSVRLKKDLIVELLSVHRMLPPNITFTYMIARDEGPRYAWQLFAGEWSPCSSMCSGVRNTVPRCTDINSGDTVEDSYCEQLDRDVVTGSATLHECNTHCRLAWKVHIRYQCSTHCGRGVRTLVHQCVRIENTESAPAISVSDTATVSRNLQHLLEHTVDDDEDLPWAKSVDEKHCSNIPKPSDIEECEGPCDATRWHYDDWSPCTKSCGGGIQTRNSWCVDANEQVLDENACAKKPRINEQTCNVQRCPTWSLDTDWTPCSVTCGRGYRTKPYHCHVDGQVLRPEACDPATAPIVREECEAERRWCAQWIAVEWLPTICSCGTLQRRDVKCMSLDGSSSLDVSHCDGMLQPNDTRLCPRHKCTLINEIEDNAIIPTFDMDYKFEWRSGPWSECSRSCGGGTKSRNVVCQSTLGAQHEEQCDAGRKPLARVHCHTHACPGWNHGDWSSCNPDCRRYRLVICQDHNGDVIKDELCPVSEKPDNVTTCYDGACRTVSPPTTLANTHYNHAHQSHPHLHAHHNHHQTHSSNNQYPLLPNSEYKWKTGEWSTCSKSCGRGMRMRQVSCTDIQHDVTVVDHFCRAIKKPKSQRSCYRSNCTHVWVEGPWTECTVSCGEGMKYRNVTCHKVVGGARNGRVHPEPVSAGKHTCDPSTKPHNHDKCVVRYCNELYSWVPGPWNECTHSCGTKGRQTRHLYCHHQNKKVPKKHCPKALKPQRRQKCNQKRCLYRSCLEIKQTLRSNQNREHELLVHSAAASASGRRILRVYCHAMNTAEPREYISLPNEGRENYAEVYDKRLIEADSCPYGGQRRDNCDCIPADSGTTGLTVFSKVKLNITSMRIIGDDYTFSRQIKGTRVPYGTAGDCYSRRTDCPQGRFSIDLTGTGLRLAERVTWTTTGVGASLTVHRQDTKVSGKCGGYCGNCLPDHRTGLLVELT